MTLVQSLQMPPYCFIQNINYQLDGNHKHCFQAKLSVTEIKQILQAWSQKFHDQCIVLPTRAKVVHLRYPLCKGLN